MNYQKVESSNIEALGHQGTTLGVKFKNGTEYLYRGVPTEVFQTLIDAASIGRTFHQLIKSNSEAYPYERAT